MRMRIISGELKRRLIQVPQSKEIRPTTDRVRETLFNLLNNKIDFNGIKVLDLYAGSGALGLECLSRGAGITHFVEKNLSIYKNLLHNIELLGVADRSVVYRMEAIKYSKLKIDSGYDLILADPPFFKDDIYAVVNNIITYEFLNLNGFLIIERSIQTKGKDILELNVEPFKIIGDACLYEIRR